MRDQHAEHRHGSNATTTTLLQERPPFIPNDVETIVLEISLPPANLGAPPHRHSGPVFGYVLEGELRFRLEGQDERVYRAGEAFWEPGGDVIHYTAANNLADNRTRFLAVIVGQRGAPIMTFPSADELAERERARSAAGAPA
jgi:quercetin dioxygenase-like cupin family protein